MAGAAGAMTVPSRISMKKAPATSSASPRFRPERCSPLDDGSVDETVDETVTAVTSFGRGRGRAMSILLARLAGIGSVVRCRRTGMFLGKELRPVLSGRPRLARCLVGRRVASDDVQRPQPFERVIDGGLHHRVLRVTEVPHGGRQIVGADEQSVHPSCHVRDCGTGHRTAAMASRLSSARPHRAIA